MELIDVELKDKVVGSCNFVYLMFENYNFLMENVYKMNLIVIYYIPFFLFLGFFFFNYHIF